MANVGSLIAQYLVHSYLYYICGVSVIPDSTFDAICKELLDRWDEVESCDHPHKHLVRKDSLEAGTAFQLRDDDYPNMVKGCATMLAKQAGVVTFDRKTKTWHE